MSTQKKSRAVQRDVLPEGLVDALLEAGKPAALKTAQQAQIKHELLARVARESIAQAHPLITTTRAGEGKWHPLAPKVDMQILFDDGVNASWFARVQPGGKLPAHDHAEGVEECLVLTGTCWLDEVYMEPGDYQVARPGSRHSHVHSDTGCVLFLRSPSFRRPERPAASLRA